MLLGLLIVVVAIVVAAAAYMNHPKFGRSPEGERLERIRKSPGYRDGAFRNRHPAPQIASGKSRLRVMMDFLFEKRERNRPEGALPVVRTDLKKLGREEELLVWFGHSSYFIQSAGKRFLVDPVFEEAAPVSFVNKPFAGTDIYKAGDLPDPDYLVITHDHWDHLDYRTVIALRERTGKVICPLGVGAHFERWGFRKEQLVELDWNEQAGLDAGFTVYCLPAHHFSGRGFESNRTLWASFMLQTPRKTIYLGGDGGYDSRFTEIARQFPVIDVAILENGQYDADWRYIHLMPEELVKAVEELRPRKLFTGHNGKYALAKHPWDEPLDKIAEAARTHGFNLVMPVIGEVVRLDEVCGPVNRWWDGIR